MRYRVERRGPFLKCKVNDVGSVDWRTCAKNFCLLFAFQVTQRRCDQTVHGLQSGR